MIRRLIKSLFILLLIVGCENNNEKWEYKMVGSITGYTQDGKKINVIFHPDKHYDGNKVEIDYVLKEMGEDGWELVQVTEQLGDSRSSTYRHYFFKRKID